VYDNLKVHRFRGKFVKAFSTKDTKLHAGKNHGCAVKEPGS